MCGGRGKYVSASKCMTAYQTALYGGKANSPIAVLETENQAVRIEDGPLPKGTETVNNDKQLQTPNYKSLLNKLPNSAQPLDQQVIPLFNKMVQDKLATRNTHNDSLDNPVGNKRPKNYLTLSEQLVLENIKRIDIDDGEIKNMWYSAVAKVYAGGGKAYKGRYVWPEISPPADAKVGPLQMAHFRSRLEIECADSLKEIDTWFGAYDGDPRWNREENARMLDNDWKNIITRVQQGAKGMWEDAITKTTAEIEARNVDRDLTARRDEEEKQHAAEVKRKAEADKRSAEAESLAETEKANKEAQKQALISNVLLSQQQRIGSSGELQEYGFSNDDNEKLESHDKYTTLQREAQFNLLWDRAKVLPSQAEVRVLYLPFPSGLPYKVKDVQISRGNIRVFLQGLEQESDKPPIAGALPYRTFVELDKALFQGRAGLACFDLNVPGSDHSFAALAMGTVIKSSDWVIIVSLDGTHRKLNFGMHCVFRSIEEFDEMVAKWRFRV